MEKFERFIIRKAHSLSATKESETYMSWIQKQVVFSAFLVGVLFTSLIFAFGLTVAYFLTY